MRITWSVLETQRIPLSSELVLSRFSRIFENSWSLWGPGIPDLLAILTYFSRLFFEIILSFWLPQNCLVLTMPEETLSLCCPTGKDKIEWFTTLQSAIVTSLASASVDQMSCTSSTNSINSIGGNTSPVKSSHCSPPLARFASYVFTKSAILKDVSYKGSFISI